MICLGAFVVDERNFFVALQSELNERISTRAAINTAHMQTVAAFVAGMLAARATAAPARPDEMEQLLAYAAYATAIIPLISFYFVALYRHNDLQIGILNLSLTRMARRANISPDINIYSECEPYVWSWHARTSSHLAIIGLCCISPFVFLLDGLFNVTSPVRTCGEALLSGSQIMQSCTGGVVIACLLGLVVSLFNIMLLTMLHMTRRRIRKLGLTQK